MELISVEEAIEKLKGGDLVAFPTETVYGLGACAWDKTAIQKIFIAKGRAADNPLIVHISNLAQVGEIAVDIPTEFYRLADHFFPGPLTVILKKHPRVPLTVSGGLDSVAIRMPKHPVAQQLLVGVKDPVVAPSANLSGTPSSTTAEHVLSDFPDVPGFVIDAGPTHYGVESTVISLLSHTMLRPGAISKEEIESVLGYSLKKGIEPSSPGMRYVHYAPKAQVLLFTDRNQFEEYPSLNKYGALSTRNLYETLRDADRRHQTELCIFCDADMRQNHALMDRLRRAARLVPEYEND